MGQRLSRLARTGGSQDRFKSSTFNFTNQPMNLSLSPSQLNNLQANSSYVPAQGDYIARPQTGSSCQRPTTDAQGDANLLNRPSSMSKRNENPQQNAIAQSLNNEQFRSGETRLNPGSSDYQIGISNTVANLNIESAEGLPPSLDQQVRRSSGVDLQIIAEGTDKKVSIV